MGYFHCLLAATAAAVSASGENLHEHSICSANAGNYFDGIDRAVHGAGAAFNALI